MGRVVKIQENYFATFNFYFENRFNVDCQRIQVANQFSPLIQFVLCDEKIIGHIEINSAERSKKTPTVESDFGAFFFSIDKIRRNVFVRP